MIRSVLLSLLLLSVLPGSADAQTQRPVSPAMQEYRKQQEPRAGTPNYPLISKDFLTALETLGVRPGMTLAQARAEAARWGARLEKADHSNLSAAAKPSPDNVYHPENIAAAFTYNAVPEATYRGHPRSFDPDTPDQNWSAGITQVFVFPADPLGDLYNPGNLIVYYINTLVHYVGRSAQRQGVMSDAEFLSEGGKRLGQKLHVAKSQNRADCGFALRDYIQRVIRLAGVVEPRVPAHLDAWKQCGSIALVQYDLTKDHISGYRVDHGDAALAERAFNAFRVYGSNQTRDR